MATFSYFQRVYFIMSHHIYSTGSGALVILFHVSSTVFWGFYAKAFFGCTYLYGHMYSMYSTFLASVRKDGFFDAPFESPLKEQFSIDRAIDLMWSTLYILKLSDLLFPFRLWPVRLCLVTKAPISSPMYWSRRYLSRYFVLHNTYYIA